MFIPLPIRKHLTKEDENWYYEVAELMGILNRIIVGMPRERRPRFECHSLCRAISMRIPELKCVDGAFFGLTYTCANWDDGESPVIFDVKRARHSWLTTPDHATIDPYPVGFASISPLIAPRARSSSAYGGNLYFPASPVMSIFNRRRLHRKSLVIARLINANAHRNP